MVLRRRQDVRSTSSRVRKVGLNRYADNAILFRELFAESLGGLGGGVGGVDKEERTSFGSEITSNGCSDACARSKHVSKTMVDFEGTVQPTS